jgi:decaprenylphospho-beta-D-erythro-pentofuranosid-2-ulose 2-reductase
MSEPGRNILILGATSAMARGTAAAFAARDDTLFLAGRDSEELQRLAADLSVRYHVPVHQAVFDIADVDSHAGFVGQVTKTLGGLDGVVLAAGFMADQSEAASNFTLVQRMVQVNYLGAMSVLDHCAAQLVAAGSGFIVGLSSVAGDRGRQSNYYYGSSKAGFSAYLSGLRNRLAGHGVRVLTVKPGFVDTAMTYGLEGMFLLASPEDIGRSIVRAVEKQRNTVYLPWFWRYIMLIIRHIPEFVFKRLKL